MKKNLIRFLGTGFFILTAALTFGTCGIDNYILLEQIPRDTIRVISNDRAEIGRFPSQPATYFSNYEIYYRIYISNRMELATITEGMLSSINTTLAGNYNSLQPYTNVDTATATNVGTIFSNLNYFPLEFGSTDYDRIGGGNRVVALDFAQTSTSGASEPSIIDGSGSAPISLVRSSRVANPAPTNRYFLNNSDLNSSANAITTKNADVQSSTTGGDQYTYVALYIVATGKDDNYSPVYSKPTFIGVFLLPDGTR
jgi:hypothetical protein